MKTSDIIYREDLYPRFEANQSIIQKYSDSIEHLPPIKVNQDNILIDGYHRWKAHQRAEVEEIKTDIIETESEKQLKRLAYRLNSNHGLQLSNNEKQKYAVEMIAECSIEELSQILSVSKEAITKWTQNARDELKKERNRKIVEDYLRAENTQSMLAEKYELTQPQIKEIIDKSINTKIYNLDSPLLYNIWKTA